MAKPRKLHGTPTVAFGLAVAIIKPPLVVLTRHRWIDGDNIPAAGGCVIVANHISHVDPFPLARLVYDHGRMPRFLAKSEVFDVPIGGRIITGAKQIPVYRQSSDASLAFRAAVAAVEAGESVVLYPEGTITRDPQLWPMTGKTGAARIALSADVPVIPVAQWGTQRILAPYGKKLSLWPPKSVTFKVGRPVDLAGFADQPLTPATLREATAHIMKAVTMLLADIRGERPPTTPYDPRTAGLPQTGNRNEEPR